MNYKILIALVTFCAAGCAMNPQIKNLTELDPSGATNLGPCYTDEPNIARKCAILTLDELEKLYVDTGNFDRAMAYTAFGLGTVTAGVLAFEGSEDILKGIAIAGGGLVGLRTIVDTNSQRQIFDRAIKELYCSIRAFNAAETAAEKANSRKLVNSYSSSAVATVFQDAQTASAKGQTISALQLMEAYEKQRHFQELASDINLARSASIRSGASSGRKLSNAVIEIRNKVRTELAGLVTVGDTSLTDQSDRVVNMVGEIVRRRAEIEREAEKNQPGPNPIDTNIINASREYFAETEDAVQVFRDCVAPSTQREIERQ